MSDSRRGPVQDEYEMQPSTAPDSADPSGPSEPATRSVNVTCKDSFSNVPMSVKVISAGIIVAGAGGLYLGLHPPHPDGPADQTTTATTTSTEVLLPRTSIQTVTEATAHVVPTAMLTVSQTPSIKAVTQSAEKGDEK